MHEIAESCSIGWRLHRGQGFFCMGVFQTGKIYQRFALDLVIVYEALQTDIV